MVVVSAFEACKIGDIETLKKLPGVVPTLVDNNGACCLHYAARGGSLAVVEYLVKSLNFSTMARTKTGVTALHDAAAKGNTAVVKWLVESGGLNVDDKDSAGVTALHVAARYCHFLTVEWLLDEACAESSIRSNEGALPLHFAVVGGDMNCVKILVDDNPRLISMQMNNGAPPIYLASQAGRLDILQYLISRNAATKVKAYDAMSCLHAAAQMGHLDIVKWLVKVDKSNPNDRDFDGNTPLHFAAARGHSEVVRWLMKEGGARVTLDNLGGSPLHSAAELGELKSVQALLDCGCDVSLTDNSGLTAAELADKCDQTHAAALIRGEVSLAELAGHSSSLPQTTQTLPVHSPHISFPQPPDAIQINTKATKTSYSQPLASPPLPPPPVRTLSISSTPSTTGSPITPPTPIIEDENDPVSALGYGHGSVNQPYRGIQNSTERPPIQRTVSRVSVDSSASNFGVFEQQEAGVIHTVTAEVHKIPKVVPPTPRPVTFSSVPGHASLNSTQESIIYSTSSSSFSQDESSPGPERKLLVQKNTRAPQDFIDKGESAYPSQHLPSPPLAHSTFSTRRDSSQSGVSRKVKEAHASSQSNTNNSTSEKKDTEKEIDKFHYYSTPYKTDFNTVTKSSFVRAKALFQVNPAGDPQICPDSGEVCSKSEREYRPLTQIKSSSKMSAQNDHQPEQNSGKSVGSIPGPSSSSSNHISQSHNELKSVISIQGNHATIISTGSKPNTKEHNPTKSSALSSTSEQTEATVVTVRTDHGASTAQIHKDNMMKELKGKAFSQITNSAEQPSNNLVNGHVKNSAANHAVREVGAVPSNLQLTVNGDTAKVDDWSTNPRNFSRSSSRSSTSSQPFSPVESKHNLIADIQSAVSGTSNLSLRRAKGRGEGVSMVYQSKNKRASQEEVKADYLPLTGQFDPKNFIDKVETVDSTGRAIPEWRRQVLAKHLAEKAQKDFEEQKSVQDNEARFKDIPAWKRALIERKEAQAREDAASNKK